MKKIIIGLLVIVSCLFLSGCYSSYNYSGESGSIVGSWIKNNRVYNFNSDGTCSYYEGERFSDCTYVDNGSTVSITWYGLNNTTERSYRVVGNKLYITDFYGNEEAFKRR